MGCHLRVVWVMGARPRLAAICPGHRVQGLARFPSRSLMPPVLCSINPNVFPRLGTSQHRQLPHPSSKCSLKMPTYNRIRQTLTCLIGSNRHGWFLVIVAVIITLCSSASWCLFYLSQLFLPSLSSSCTRCPLHVPCRTRIFLLRRFI